jgi:hypothetical protein
MSNHKKIDPFQIPIESLQGFIERCRQELQKPLLDDVRATTEDSLKNLESILAARLNIEEPTIPPRPELQGVGLQIEKEWMQKEAQIYSGEVKVIERQGEFYALMRIGNDYEEVAESTVIRRITAAIANFMASKRHKLGLQDEILKLRGFDTLTNYVQAMRFIKYTKCQYYNVPFSELQPADVYKFSKLTKSKLFYLQNAINRAIALVPA